MLMKMVRKSLLKNNQASSTDGMRSMSLQDTPARLQKCFRERLTVMRGGCLVADQLRMQAMITEILIENSRGVFGGRVS
jgi:hypothetical protein